MSIPGWEPTPKAIESWLDRNRWAQWLVVAIAGAWFVAQIAAEISRAL